VFAFFERLIAPFPDELPPVPPKGLGRFIWACTAGMRRHIAVLALLTAAIGIFEALMFAFMGEIVDGLSGANPATWWAEHQTQVLWMGVAVLASPLLMSVWALSKYQTLHANFPMRLRWMFHRQMLAQSLAFYQDEFAGRVATKVMQTALAVRDTVMTMADILVYVLIYFGTMVVIVASFSTTMMWPFMVWLGLYLVALRYFVPRLARVGQAQADARSLMTGRVADAYHQHRHRQAVLAHEA
jgi:ATP-binding cassette subfamily B multidrug efflux pump